MNKKLFTIMLVCLLAITAFLVASCTKANAQSISNVRWEYTISDVRSGFNSSPDNSERIKRANALGDQGWELVGVTGNGWVENMVFKRRLP